MNAGMIRFFSGPRSTIDPTAVVLDDSRSPSELPRFAMDPVSSGAVTFLFTDIERSTRLWEGQPDKMREALARHDVVPRHAVEANGGTVVKMVGDGVNAAFRGQRRSAALRGVHRDGVVSKARAWLTGRSQGSAIAPETAMSLPRKVRSETTFVGPGEDVSVDVPKVVSDPTF